MKKSCHKCFQVAETCQTLSSKAEKSKVDFPSLDELRSIQVWYVRRNHQSSDAPVSFFPSRTETLLCKKRYGLGFSMKSFRVVMTPKGVVDALRRVFNL